MKIIYFGTPKFAAEVLDYLMQNGVDIQAVVSKPDKPQGRSGTPVPVPVKLIAEKYSLPIYQPAMVSAPEFASTIAQYDADMFVVVAYGEILKQHVLDMPKQACINLHASLLPKYRGAAPIQRVIMNGETETGATIMHMVKKMDAGDMIAKTLVPITPDMTYGELETSLCESGKKALLEVIQKWPLPATPQDHTQATLAPKVELEDCELHWDQPAQTLHNLIRGVNPEPGAWCWVQVKGEKKRLKIFRSEMSSKGPLIVNCADQPLTLLEVQLEGKKRMPAKDLLMGLANNPITFL